MAIDVTSVRKDRLSQKSGRNGSQAASSTTPPVPTRRMAFAKQLEVLRAYPSICGASPRAVTNAEVGAVVGLAAETVGNANPFFVGINLLARSESGSCIPSQELMNFCRAYKWDPEKAFWKLAPAFEKTWFAGAILPKLRFRGMSEEEAISSLADAAALPPEFRGQIKMLLDYLVEVGIVARDNGLFVIGPALAESTPTETSESEPAEKPKQEGPQVSNITTGFRRANEGGIHLSINIDVDTTQMSKWRPERITAFMSGLAQVLAAKGEMEQQEIS
jgi:hypothetical protein